MQTSTIATKQLVLKLNQPAEVQKQIENMSPSERQELSAEWLALVESVAHLSHLYQTGLATRALRDSDGAFVYQRKG